MPARWAPPIVRSQRPEQGTYRPYAIEDSEAALPAGKGPAKMDDTSARVQTTDNTFRS